MDLSNSTKCIRKCEVKLYISFFLSCISYTFRFLPRFCSRYKLSIYTRATFLPLLLCIVIACPKQRHQIKTCLSTSVLRFVDLCKETNSPRKKKRDKKKNRLHISLISRALAPFVQWASLKEDCGRYSCMSRISRREFGNINQVGVNIIIPQ